MTTSKGQRGAKKQASATTTTTSAGLSALEESVIRMRGGLPALSDTPLTSKAGGNEELAQRLRAMELRAFMESGRLDEMRQEAEADVSPKDRIIDALRAKSPSDD